MKLRRISVQKCKEGDILARDVVNEHGVLIAVKNTEMNSFIKEKLIELSIFDVIIWDQNSSSYKEQDDNSDINIFYHEYIMSIDNLKNIFKKLISGNGLDYNELNNMIQLINNKMGNSSSVIQCLQSIKATDEYTYTHSINTAIYAMFIGKSLKLSEHEINKAVQAGLLHDIGKIIISEEILNKKGKLTDEEYETMKLHTVLGYAVLQDVEGIDPDVKRSALLHHERIDRSGYPFNASSECVCLLAKIIAVADVYDAMTSDRVYKKRNTPFNAFSMFSTIGIGLFDTTILYTFLRNIATCYIGMNVSLSNGQNGKIVYIPPQDLANPIVKTKSGYIDLGNKEKFCIVAMG